MLVNAMPLEATQSLALIQHSESNTMQNLIRDFLYAFIFAIVMFCPLIAWFVIYGG